MKKENEVYNVENDDKFTVIRYIVNILCLITPVVFAFLGYFLSPLIYSVLFNENLLVSEIFKFICSLTFFAISSLVIYLKSRNTNPYIKIRVS